MRYTVAVNNNEYMKGLFNSEDEALEEVRQLMIKDGIVEAEEMQEGCSDDLWDLSDGYGYGVVEIILPEEQN